MESRVKLLGHPVHPMLIVFPLGLLSTALVFDILYFVTNVAGFATFSYWAILAGVVGGLLAAVFGLTDWLGIPRGTRAKRIGATHGLGNLVVVTAFALSFWLRLDTPGNAPDTTTLVLELVGAGVALVTAWLGGELVYRLGVAVDEDAGLNASSSLEREGLADVEA